MTGVVVGQQTDRMSTSIQPGWYPDPARPELLWWWDGTAYTQSRPAEVAAVVEVAAPPVVEVAPVIEAPPTFEAAPVVQAPPVFEAAPAVQPPPVFDAAPAVPVSSAAPAAPAYQSPPAYQAAPAYPTPPAYQAAPIIAGRAPGASSKSRMVASLLSFFLGGLGVDRFYLGNIGMSVAKLLLGWLTLGIWPLIDFIIVIVGKAHDGQGLPVTEWN